MQAGRRHKRKRNFLADMPRKGWTCRNCTLCNRSRLQTCEVCGASRPDLVLEETSHSSAHTKNVSSLSGDKQQQQQQKLQQPPRSEHASIPNKSVISHDADSNKETLSKDRNETPAYDERCDVVKWLKGRKHGKRTRKKKSGNQKYQTADDGGESSSLRMVQVKAVWVNGTDLADSGPLHALLPPSQRMGPSGPPKRPLPPQLATKFTSKNERSHIEFPVSNNASASLQSSLTASKSQTTILEPEQAQEEEEESKRIRTSLTSSTNLAPFICCDENSYLGSPTTLDPCDTTSGEDESSSLHLVQLKAVWVNGTDLADSGPLHALIPRSQQLDPRKRPLQPQVTTKFTSTPDCSSSLNERNHLESPVANEADPSFQSSSTESKSQTAIILEQEHVSKRVIALASLTHVDPSVCGDEGINVGSPHPCDTTNGSRMEDIVTVRLPHPSDIEDTTSQQEDVQLMIPSLSATQPIDDDVVEIEENITTRTELLTDHLDGSTTTVLASARRFMEITSDAEIDRNNLVGVEQDSEWKDSRKHEKYHPGTTREKSSLHQPIAGKDVVCTEERHISVQSPSTSPKPRRSGDCINSQSVPPCINPVIEVGLMTNESIETQHLPKTPLHVPQQANICSKPLAKDGMTIKTALDFINPISSDLSASFDVHGDHAKIRDPKLPSDDTQLLSINQPEEEHTIMLHGNNGLCSQSDPFSQQFEYSLLTQPHAYTLDQANTEPQRQKGDPQHIEEVEQIYRGVQNETAYIDICSSTVDLDTKKEGLENKVPVDVTSKYRDVLETSSDVESGAASEIGMSSSNQGNDAMARTNVLFVDNSKQERTYTPCHTVPAEDVHLSFITQPTDTKGYGELGDNSTEYGIAYNASQSPASCMKHSSGHEINQSSLCTRTYPFGVTGNGTIKSPVENQTSDTLGSRERERHSSKVSYSFPIPSQIDSKACTTGSVFGVPRDGIVKNAIENQTSDAFGNRAKARHSNMATESVLISNRKDTKATPGMHFGFSTAGSGTTVSFTTEDLERAESILNCPDENKAKRDRDNVQPILHLENASKASFSTAGSVATALVSMKKTENVSSFSHAGRESKEHQQNQMEMLSTGKRNTWHNNKSKMSSMQRMGFSSAGSGAPVTISEDALQRAENLLCDPITYTNDSISCELNTSKELELSKAANAVSLRLGDNSALNKPHSAHMGRAGFSTAGSGSTVSVSKEAMQRAAEMFKDDSDISLLYAPGTRRAALGKEKASGSSRRGNDSCTNKSHRERVQQVGFSTAGLGAHVVVSEEALKRAKNLFDCESKSKNYPLNLNAPGSERHRIDVTSAKFEIEPKPRFGFSTAGSGASIEISKDAFEKADAMFNSDIKSKSDQLHLIANESESNGMVITSAESHKSPAKMVGFSTAGSGANVVVSEEALQRAKNIFDCEIKSKSDPLHLDAHGSEKHEIGVSSVKFDTKRKPTFGFSTAGSGASIEISKDAFEKADAMFNSEIQSKIDQHHLVANELERNGMVIMSAESHESPQAKMVGFLTAGSGANVVVSKEAWERAEYSFNDRLLNEKATACGEYTEFQVEETSVSCTLARSNKSESITSHGIGTKLFDATSSILPERRVGFSAAGSGALVTCTKEALQKAETLFSCPTESTKYAENFQTNEYKEKRVSPILAESRPALEGTPARRGHEPIAEQVGFSMAGSGAILEVSDEAMQKAETMLSCSNKTKNGSFDSEPIGEEDRKGIKDDDGTPVSSSGANTRVTCRVLFQNNGESLVSPQQSSAFNKVDGESELHISGSNKISQADKGFVENVSNVSTFKFQDTQSHKSSSYTPLQTPRNMKSALVTRSTITKNPYDRSRYESVQANVGSDSIMSPVPFKFSHIKGNFRDKIISPEAWLKAKDALFPDTENHRYLSRSIEGKTIQKSSSSTVHINAPTSATSLYKGKSDALMLSKGEKINLSDLKSRCGQINESHKYALERGVKSITLKINSENASRLRFDAVSLLPCSFLFDANVNPRETIGKVADIHHSLIESGCDGSLLSESWIHNHCRWIIWKLACTERRFPYVLGGRYLNYASLVNQLTLRYRKELSRAKRPALRMILNRDIASSKPMILCVSQILRYTHKSTSTIGKQETSCRGVNDELRLELTDGWYSVPALIDDTLKSFVVRGKIQIGTKLLVCNAVMVGNEDGIDPLDSSYQPTTRKCPVVLKLAANATRMAKWDAKLGFAHCSSTFKSNDGMFLTSSLASVIPDGGNIPLIDVIICRRFPMLFLQKIGTNVSVPKSCDASRYLNQGQEAHASKRFEMERQHAVERLGESVEEACSKEVDEGAPLQWTRMMTDQSPGDYYERLSVEDMKVVDTWKDKRTVLMQEKSKKLIDVKLTEESFVARETTPLMKFYVRSYMPHDKKKSPREEECTGAILTCWRISEDQSDILKEGVVVRLKNVGVRSTLHDDMLQLTANPKTCIETVSKQPQNIQLVTGGYFKRSYLSIVRATIMSRKLGIYGGGHSHIGNQSGMVDIAGLLIKAVVEDNGSSQTIYLYLTDESGLVLRIQREFSDPDGDPCFLSWSQGNCAEGSDKIFVCRDIRILPFDHVENCGAAMWDLTSTHVVNFNSPRIRSLRKFSTSEDGKAALHFSNMGLETGICFNSKLGVDHGVAIGYIVEFSLSSAERNKVSSIVQDDASAQSSRWWPSVIAHVDFGKASSLLLDIPMFLFHTLLRIYGDDFQYQLDCLDSHDEVNIDSMLDNLGRVARDHGDLLHFVVGRKRKTESIHLSSRDSYPCGFEVKHLRKADHGMLASFYLNDMSK